MLSTKAHVRGMLYNANSVGFDVLMRVRHRLQEWRHNLPESMSLQSLVRNTSIEAEDRSKTLFIHQTHLSTLMVLPLYLARSWVETGVTRTELYSIEAIRSLDTGFLAAHQCARIPALLRPEKDISERWWFCL